MGFALFFSLEIFLFSGLSLIDFKNKYQKNLGALLMFGLMFVFAAIRGSGDGDYYNYLWFAKDIGTDFSKVMNFSYPVEFSFRFFSYFINLIGASRQWVIVLMNFLSIGPVVYVTLKKSANPFLSALIFLPIFLQFDMQTSRTATAMGLGLMAIFMQTERKRIKSLIFLLLAISFHRSALILLPFLLYLEIDISNFTKIFLVLASFVLSVFSKLLFKIIAKILQVGGMARMATKVISYTFEGKFAYAMKLYDPRIIFGLLLFIMSIMYFDKKSFDKHSMESASIKAIFFGLVVMLIFRSSTAIAFRFSAFFNLMQIFFIPLVIKEIKYKDSLACFLLILSIGVFILPYAIYIMIDAPAYDFFFTNLQAITSLR